MPYLSLDLFYYEAKKEEYFLGMGKRLTYPRNF